MNVDIYHMHIRFVLHNIISHLSYWANICFNAGKRKEGNNTFFAVFPIKEIQGNLGMVWDHYFTPFIWAASPGGHIFSIYFRYN